MRAVLAAHVRLARLLLASGRTAQAQRHCDAALAILDADSVRFHWQLLFELALVAVRLGDRAQAVTLLQRAVAIEPRAAEAHTNLAAQLMIDGALDDALRHCEAALEIAPELPEAHFNMNVLLRRAGRQQEAIERYWGLIEAALGCSLRPTPTSCSNISQSDDAVRPRPRPAATDAGEDDTVPPLYSTGTTGVSVVCVKWGIKYGADYVNKLFAAVVRNAADSSSAAIDFVCLTDDASGISTQQENLRCLPLEPGWTGWWNKLQVFSPRVAAQLRHDACVYVDLDTVVVGSLAQLLGWRVPRGDVALLRTDGMANEQRHGGYNSSVMMWRREREAKAPPRFRLVYELLQDHFETVSRFIYKFDHWLEMALPRVLFLDDVFPGVVVEYRSLDEAAPTPPTGASVVCFPLQPKPHNAPAAWVQQHWQ